MLKQFLSLSIFSMCFISLSYAMQSEDSWKQYTELTCIHSQDNFMTNPDIYNQAITLLETIIAHSTSASEVVSARVELAMMLTGAYKRASGAEAQFLASRVLELCELVANTPIIADQSSAPYFPLHYKALALFTRAFLKKEAGLVQEARDAYEQATAFVDSSLLEVRSWVFSSDPVTNELDHQSTLVQLIQGFEKEATV